MNLKKELSKFYNLGYKFGFKTALLRLQYYRNKNPEHEVLFRLMLDDLLDYYNNYPMIQPLELEEIKDEK